MKTNEEEDEEGRRKRRAVPFDNPQANFPRI